MLLQHLLNTGLAHGPPAAGLLGVVYFGQRRVWVLLHVREQPSLGRRVKVAGASAHSWFGRQCAGGGLAAYQVLDEGAAYAEVPGYGRLFDPGLLAGRGHAGA